jgi:hypothetical protein
MNRATMSEGAVASCLCCCYFRAVDALTGSCHRYPPVFAGDSSPREAHHWRHPVVGPHGWCGEYRLVSEAQMSSSGVTI